VTGERGTPEALADLLVANLSATPALAGIAVTDVVKPTLTTGPASDSGVLSLAFARAPYRGRLRAQIGKTGAYAVLACFWNEREPAACEAACTQLVGSMK
jgi:hypothetical protein